MCRLWGVEEVVLDSARIRTGYTVDLERDWSGNYSGKQCTDNMKCSDRMWDRTME